MVAPPSPAELAPRPDALYGADGVLLPSEERVVGIVLPRGLRAVGRAERRYFFESDEPVEALQRYLGPRLITGEVEPVGSGVIFRRAAPRDARGADVRVDVLVAASSAARSSVTITEYERVAPGTVRVSTEQEIEQRMREDATR